MQSPFDVLGVDPDADETTIERAYRRRVLEAHPDHGGSPAEFQRVRAAYEELAADRPGATDPERVDTSGSDPEAADDEPAEPAARVEYLNYEVLAEEGWSLEDEDLFERAAGADLDHRDHGRLLVHPGETLLEAAENRGYAWPFACRGGACANCAVAVTEGELSTPVNHILPGEQIDRGIRLSCVGAPVTGDAKVVYNVKHLPNLDELRLPPRPFERARADD